jgi:peptidyl-prolyl cis-trans isomerase C
MNLAHILVAQKYEAEDIQRKLTQGEDFESLARKFSTCPSAREGGRLGNIELRRLDEAFVEAALQLKPSQISPVVRTRFGFHLIKRLS